MQINGGRPVDYYPLVPANNRNAERTPVVFDASKTLTVVPVTQTGSRTNQVAPAVQSEDSTSARLIKEFNIDKSYERRDSSSPRSAKSTALLTYETIDDLTTTPSQRRGQNLDEVV